MGNEPGVDIFISIHCNASANTAAYGSSAHWYKTMDWPLARTVLSRLVVECRCVSRGAQRNRFFVLRHSNMPAVLVETAFITNDKEGLLLSTPQYRQSQAVAIFDGLKSYVVQHGHSRASMRK